MAVLGRGLAIVEDVGEKQVFATLSNRRVLRIGRTEVVWDERNLRWESIHPVVSLSLSITG